MTKVLVDAYFFIDVTWKDGLKHTVACRGYNLKSQMMFHDSIFWIDTYKYYEVTQKQYEDKVYGTEEEQELLRNDGERMSSGKRLPKQTKLPKPVQKPTKKPSKVKVK